MTDNQNAVVKKPFFSFDKKEMMYALIVVFLLFIMYYLGQLSTHSMLEEVRTICPALKVSSVSPFGVTFVKGPFLPDYNASLTFGNSTVVTWQNVSK